MHLRSPEMKIAHLQFSFHLGILGGIEMLFRFKFLCLLQWATALESRNLTFVVSARGLPAKDELSVVDPVVHLFYSTTGSAPKKYATSEHLHYNDNPDWVKVFWFQWRKGTGQRWNLRLCDQDPFFEKDLPLGEAFINVDDYVEGGENMTVPLSRQGTLTIQGTTPISFKLSARDIPRRDGLHPFIAAFIPDHSNSDPYVKCYFRKGIGGKDKHFATTSSFDDKVDADWEEIIEFGNYQRGQSMYLRFELKDKDPVLDDDKIGQVLLELDPFAEAMVPQTLRVHKVRSKSPTSATLTITPVS